MDQKTTTHPAEIVDCGIVKFVPAGDGTYRILIGGQQIGELLVQGSNYRLRYILTGGGFSGSGDADFSTDVGQLKVVAHVFKLLAEDTEAHIADMEG